MIIIVIARSNQGLINAFEHWSWELRLVQGVSWKILGSEAKENKTKEINIIILPLIDLNASFFFFGFISLSLGSKDEF